ncbi:hypothetical protein ACP70R_021194 [Stipagrostis hirtigluma subsp. patula]
MGSAVHCWSIFFLGVHPYGGRQLVVFCHHIEIREAQGKKGMLSKTWPPGVIPSLLIEGLEVVESKWWICDSDDGSDNKDLRLSTLMRGNDMRSCCGKPIERVIEGAPVLGSGWMRTMERCVQHQDTRPLVLDVFHVTDARVHNGQRRPVGTSQLLPSGVIRLRQRAPPQVHRYRR